MICYDMIRLTRGRARFIRCLLLYVICWSSGLLVWNIVHEVELRSVGSVLNLYVEGSEVASSS